MKNEYTIIKERLQKLHHEEDLMNKALTNFDKQILSIKKQKLKLAKKISGNMRYRNQLIERL